MKLSLHIYQRIANMPAWGTVDAKLGNNPFAVAIPYGCKSIVLDMGIWHSRVTEGVGRN